MSTGAARLSYTPFGAERRPSKNAACGSNLLLHILNQTSGFLRHFETVPDIFKKRGGGQCNQGRKCFHQEMPQARSFFLVALCVICCGRAGVAEPAMGPEPLGISPPKSSSLTQANGLLELDYLKLTLTDGGTFDLLGVSYLQQLNDWLYWGGGLAAPLVEGNYGGFFAAYAALHAQKNVFGNWFVDAGLAVGAGAGGASVGNIQELSGSGAYLREYLGVGYRSGKLNFGVNYAKVGISNSLIDDSAISVFVQKPLSFTVGRYADAGRRLGLNDGYDRKTENMISFQYSNLSQIDPQGKYGGDIGLVSAQFSHFFNDDNYLFFSLDLGLSGLIWYNQAQGGIGRRFPLSSHINL